VAIVEAVELRTTALWQQGDIRDPLGVWGFRLGITGDASGGSIKMTGQAAASQRAAYIYTCYSLTYAQLTGATTATILKARLLTNWPDVDPGIGVQGFATLQVGTLREDANFTEPVQGMNAVDTFLKPNDRFILLFDPRPIAAALDIVEMELSDNVNLATYSFEGYGYYWDRSVLNAPGGPRHPGSS